MDDGYVTTPVQLAAMVVAVIVAVVVSVSFVIVNGRWLDTPVIIEQPTEALSPGVYGRLSAGGATIERAWRELNISLAPGQPIDDAFSVGAMEAEFLVVFRPQRNLHAQIGAMLQGGSLIIMRDDEVLLSDYAGAEAKLTLTRLPVYLPRRIERLRYIFRTDGALPVRLQAMWKPEDAGEPSAIPTR